MPVVGMFPMAGWKEAFDGIGDAMNVPDLGTKLGIERVQAAAMNGELPEQQAAAAEMQGDKATPKAPKAQPKPPANPGSMARPGNRVQAPKPKETKAPKAAQGQKARMAGVT
jgi:hypothetical protein